MKQNNPAITVQTNTLKVAILAEINNQGPTTGYSLTKSIPDSANWHASHQQIYRECRSLLSEGLLSVETLANEGKPDSRVYSMTDEGRKVLLEIRNGSEFKSLTFKNQLTVMLLAGSTAYFDSAIETLQKNASRLHVMLNDNPEQDAKRLSLELELDIVNTELKFANSAKGMLIKQ